MKNIKKLLSTLIFSTIGGLLGAFAGADKTSKAWRRIGIPLVITLYALFTMRNWWVITVMSMCGALSLGYGIPDENDPKGSTIGRFWYRIWNKNHLLADIFTRATIGVAVSVSLLSIAILGQNWLLYGLISIGIIAIYATISWRGLGTFKFKNKQLLVSEFTLYSVIVLLIQILIFFSK